MATVHPIRKTDRLAAFLAVLAQLEARFTEALGPGIEMRVQPRTQTLVGAPARRQRRLLDRLSVAAAPAARAANRRAR